jgi:hypothetical protein
VNLQGDNRKPTGRPSSYTFEIAEEICERLSSGQSLLQICQDEHMPARVTVYRWAEANEAFRNKFARAREEMAHFHFDHMWEIARDDKGDFFYDEKGNAVADHARLNRHKLQIDVLKFRAMKLLPRIYGDRPTDEAPQQAMIIKWGGTTETAPPSRHEPPRQIAYKKPELPADLSEADWSTMLDLLELVKRTVPTNSDKPPEEVFGVMKRALMEHFRT